MAPPEHQLPLSHSAHGPPRAPYHLATHTQSVAALLPDVALELAGHSAHVSAEVAARAVENVVASHTAQAADPVLAL